MKHLTENEMISKLAAYCSLGERCDFEVRKKLTAWGAPPDAAKRIIERLKSDNYLNEERYCRSFVSDKFRFNHWGKIKIGIELHRKNIDTEAVNAALDLIDGEEYEATLMQLLKDRRRSVSGDTDADVFRKLCRFAAGRGFEAGLIVKCLKTLLKQNFNEDDFPETA
ncbi:MAG: RecX family transcriptional regulator [Tannerella sp.]|jgi:regulatory protein|nr:RecX family transcriptional regulator [Tannerella sp.]